MKYLPILLLTSCSQMNPRFTADETKCIAEAKARTVLKLDQCGKDVTGDCSTDSIIDIQTKEMHACLERH